MKLLIISSGRSVFPGYWQLSSLAEHFLFPDFCCRPFLTILSRDLCTGDLFRCQADRGASDDLFFKQIGVHRFRCHDPGCFCRLNDLHGLCAPCGKKVHNMSMLVISGVMIGYICSAITDFVVTFADDSNIVNLHNWSLGSFSGMTWGNVQTMAVVVLLTMVIVFFMSKPISAYQLGETYAQNMGVNIKAFRILLILLSSILSACVTAFAGPISFVGIAVPHIAKSLLKTAKPLLVIPACFLGGAVFCLFCDLIARTVFAPTELSISSVTAVFGAPVVIYIMIHRQQRI